ncbi:MAG: hypothetical protein MI974_14770 [Chitinophagales bacterium]|nr:hypothetical protein [Chitinophagales bacterium]
MKRIFPMQVKWTFIALIISTISFLPSCATVVSKSHYPVYIHSEPVGAEISVMSERKGMVFRGYTPTNVILKASDGFFRRARYTIRFSKEGYKDVFYPLTASIDGWYFGNVLLGGFGLSGVLIIDPLSGAMYKLEAPIIKVALGEIVGNNETPGLHIMEMDAVPEEWKGCLVEVVGGER